ncbi:dephospho-CoA kinase [Flavobacterium caeni]|uniref:Dephospho-CoA kinase n=1 Tax=Flavobacterium caeni TaxID=490189 RepID=A0A1G5BFZ3_9FLAO|nr:dephospho-CoA kinase [Flavobacterium caeni]SCX89093.1 dephospho-CoA kinase [Flavobacterium caeni]
MTKILGLTGGIGSGKTTISKFFESMGIPVYVADDQGRRLTESKPMLSKIRETFGDAVFDGEKLDRKKLSQMVFADPGKLQQLNGIVHPAVRKHFAKWLTTHQDKPWVIRESAILFESGSYQDCDKIVTVAAPVEKRIERVMRRDGVTREQVLQRIGNQMTDAERAAKSDFVIENTDLQSAEKQAQKILKNLQIDKK